LPQVIGVELQPLQLLPERIDLSSASPLILDTAAHDRVVAALETKAQPGPNLGV
jgi:hypothetical protein